MNILVYMFVVAFLGDHVLCQQVDEDRSLLASQLTAIQTLCKPHDNTPTSTSCTRCESQPGKRGPKGEVGETGQKGSHGVVGETGPAGIVNQTLLDAQQTRITELDVKVEQLEADKDVLDTKVEQLEADKDELNTKVEKLETDNDVLKNKVEDLEGIVAVIRCPHNGIIYGDSCFFALDRKYTFEAAQTACAVHGHLAYIDTPEVYDAVKPYLRRKVVAAGSSKVYFWIGATIEPSSSNRRITFLDGRTITWSHDWDSSYPSSSSSSYTAMLWEVWATEQSSDQGGFWNHTPTYSQRPLCQKAI